jgi:hypothetical protein
MDLIEHWDWRAWTLAVLFVWFIGWLVWRWLSALVFQYVLLGGMLRRYGWRAEHPDNSGALPEFKQQVREQGAENRAHIREHGVRGAFDVARNAKLRPPASPWRADVSITGADHRGRTFLASQNRRYEYGSSGAGQGYGAHTRRRAVLELYVLPPSQFDAANALPRFEARTGLLTGKVRGAPAGLEPLLRSRRLRRVRCDGATLFAPLGPRLRRGPLLAGLAHLGAIADRLRPI